MFDIEDHGSILLFRPLTGDCQRWLVEHTDEDAQWFGNALVVEHRYASDLAHALVDEGFACQ